MLLSPVEQVTEAEREQGLRNLVKDGGYAQALSALTSGVLLIGYALALGASNLTIGLLAAVPFLAQLSQIPTILLVERWRARRFITVTCLVASRIVLVPMAFLPLLASQSVALVLLVTGTAIVSVLGSMAACSWNSWMHDLVPERRLGDFFARRLFYATGFAMAVGLAAGVFIDWWKDAAIGPPPFAYLVLFVVGSVAGAISAWYLVRVPEPRMAAPERTIHLGRMLREPFMDHNFRQLMWFLGAWQFATNLAAPFFTVYLVSQLGYSMSFVTLMTVVSQVANLAVLRMWGNLSDRISNKTVLRVCGPLFLVCIFAWTQVAMPHDRHFAILLLTVLHILMGIATAGVNLASGNIGLKLAPRGRATAYLAASSIVNSLTASLAPIIGGLFADDFAARELSLVVRWISGPHEAEFVTLHLRHWDFFFALACLFGLYALHRLTLVHEEGAEEDRDVMQEVMMEARRTVNGLYSIAGLRVMTTFPFGRIVQAARAKRERPRGQTGEMG